MSNIIDARDRFQPSRPKEAIPYLEILEQDQQHAKRLLRIKDSLKRINELLTNLKKMSEDR